LLVTNSSRGYHLVFKYPLNPSIGKKIESLSALTADLDNEMESCFLDNNSSRCDLNTYLGLDTQLLANILSPKASLCNKEFQLCIDELIFIGHPVLLNPSQKPSDKRQKLSMFNLVFVFHQQNLPGKDFYKNIIWRLSMAMKFEQERSSYIGKQAEIIIGYKEEMGESLGQYQLLVDLMERSSLAQNLANVFQGIYEGKMVHIILNNQIDICLSLPPKEPLSPTAIFPYQSLLFLQDTEEILKELPLDSNTLLSQFLQFHSPRKNLEDLQRKIDCSWVQISEIAAHFCFWNKAKIINPIHLENIYIIHPDANLSK
jgi:hypothetical protein